MLVDNKYCVVKGTQPRSNGIVIKDTEVFEDSEPLVVLAADVLSYFELAL